MYFYFVFFLLTSLDFIKASYLLLATAPTTTNINEREYIPLNMGINFTTVDTNLPTRSESNLDESALLLKSKIFCPNADSTHTVPNIERKRSIPAINMAKGAPTKVTVSKKSGIGTVKSITNPTA